MQKFLDDIKSNYPVRIYKTPGFSIGCEAKEARAFITNVHMCKFLYEDLGLIPRRNDASKMIKHIPQEFHKYFILGLFDADGSFNAYQSHSYGEKLNVLFGGSESLLRFIEQHLVDNNIAEFCDGGRKLVQRYKGKDGKCLSLRFTGKLQGMRILNYLYDSPIYLYREYAKYLELPYHNN